VKSMWHLGGLTPRQLARRVWTEIDHDDVLGRASELAFNFNLALFPFLLFLLSVVGVFAAQAQEIKARLFFYLSQLLPASASELITRTVNEVTSGSGGGKITFGLLFAMWAASGGMTAMMAALNVAYHVKESRSWLRRHAIALVLTLVISVLVLSALMLVLFGGRIAESIAANTALGNAFVMTWKIVQWPAALFLMTFAFALIYYFGPDLKEQHWYWITPGSIVGVLCWLLVSYAFRIYLYFFDSYNKTYGSLGAAIILLLWLYVTGLAFLVGGEINAEIEHAAARRGHPEAKAEGEKAA
jgi:membrane protein